MIGGSIGIFFWEKRSNDFVVWSWCAVYVGWIKRAEEDTWCSSVGKTAAHEGAGVAHGPNIAASPRFRFVNSRRIKLSIDNSAPNKTGH
jgi:hypothetical protein